jgi:hypothetical protein
VYRDSQKKNISFKIPGASNNAGSLSSHFITSLVPVWLLEHPPIPFGFSGRAGVFTCRAAASTAVANGTQCSTTPKLVYVGLPWFAMVYLCVLLDEVPPILEKPSRMGSHGSNMIKDDQILQTKGSMKQLCKATALICGYIYEWAMASMASIAMLVYQRLFRCYWESELVKVLLSLQITFDNLTTDLEV